MSYRIIFTGGGSGGHILPLVGIIKEVQKLSPSSQLLYVGTKGDIAGSLLPTDINYKAIYSGKLRRYFSLQNFTDILKLLYGVVEAIKIIRDFKPHIIFSKGGYGSIPVGISAYLFKIPLITHESDATLGLANKILVRLKAKLLLGFPLQAYTTLPALQGDYAGIPLNPYAIEGGDTDGFSLKEKWGISLQLPVVLIVGGSQGASAINNIVKESLPVLTKDYFVIHITGRRDFSVFKDLSLTNYRSFPYIKENFSQLLSLSDVVVSRAGATALAEIGYWKKPAVIIPLPNSANNHQWLNALFLSKKSACILKKQSELTQEQLLSAIKEALKRKEELSKNIASLFLPDAALRIANFLLDYLKRR